MNPIKFITHRKTFVSMVFIGLSLLGYISYRGLPLELMPNVEYPYLIIRVSSTREMNPLYVEKQAIIPLEGAVGTIEGISEIQSTAEQRGGSIYVYYDQTVDINYAYIKLLERVAEFAPSITDEFSVSVTKIDTERLSNMFMRLQVRGSGTLDRVRSVIDKSITEQLTNIDGIANVEISGGQVKSVDILLNKEATEASGMTTGRIRSLISQNSAREAFVGHAYDNNRHYFVNVVANYTDVKDLENIVVDRNGPVLLRDIAEITFGLKEETSISRINGMSAVTMMLVRDANVNLIELSHTTREVIDRLNRELAPQDIEIVIQSDTAEEMESNLKLIKELAVTGGLLALLILWYFLKNARLVTIVLLAMPVSILTAFNLFYFFDISLNSLTLVGIALAVGMLLDNSVVVLENIYRHVSLGRDRDTAVERGTAEVWRSIVAATLTTITVFLPFVFASDPVVRMIGRHIGVSIISTLVISLVVALVLVPAAVHALLGATREGGFIFTGVSHHNRLVQIYNLLLKSAIRFPARTIIAAVVIFFVFVAVSFTLSLDVSREIDLKEFNLYVTMPNGSTLDRTDSVTAELEGLFTDIEEIQDIVSTIYDEEAAVSIVLKDDYEKIAGRTISQIKGDIQQRINNFRIAEVSLSEPRSSARFGGGGGGMNPAVSLERMFGIGSAEEKVIIKGNDFELMNAVGDDIKYHLDDLDIISRTSLDVAGNRPEVHIMFDRMLMTRDSIPVSAVTSELATFQAEMTTEMKYQQGTDEYDIVIRTGDIDTENVKTYDDLALLRIPNSDGARFELASISNIVYSYGLSGINRLNQEKRIELTYSFQSEVTDSKSYLEAARAEVDEIVAAINVPPGIALEVVHDETDLSEFLFLIAAAFILIYMILASVFESISTPVVMMFTIPLATIGSFGALILTGNSLRNANSLIGFLILLGVVVNNGIILIDYARILKRRGYRTPRALMTAGQARIRPILITTITTIVAMVPLALGKAEYVTRIGAPFAITVIGGLAVSTLFTLIFIPTVYSALESSLEWFWSLDRRIIAVQTIIFAGLFFLVWNYVDSALWTGFYILLSVVGVPAATWFMLSSLRRAQEEYIPRYADLTVSIRRAVKIYDGDVRFIREWKKGARMKALFGNGKTYGTLRDFESLAWQAPVMAFLVYFVYFYIRSDFWLFVLSHLNYAFGFVIVMPFVRHFAYRAETTGRAMYRRLSGGLRFAYMWGFPLLSLVIFRQNGFRIAPLIFTAIVWYSALSISAAASRLNRLNINIMRLKGRFAGLRRVFYQFVRIIPVIGRKKRPFNALDGVSLEITNGMFGLLGPNGAGKTTLMRIVCGIYDKTMGTVRLNGIDFAEKREELQGLIGYLPQEFGTYENMTAYEFLDYLSILKGMYASEERAKRVEYCLKSVHLFDERNRRIGTYSGGMKQRMGIALTLLHLPRILVVDEPTAGLDPRERIRFRNLLVGLSSDRIVIFSTHIIEDISSSCNKVAVLDRGKLHYLGNPQMMTKAAEGKVWQFTAPESEFASLRETLRIVHHMRIAEGIRVRCLANTSPHEGAITVTPTLEDAYLWLLGRKIGPGDEPAAALAAESTVTTE